MAKEDFDESRYLGQPVELYYFRYGSDISAFYAFTDADRPITHEGVVYEPSPMKRGKITSSQSLDKSEMKLRTTLSSPVAELFIVYPPSDVVTVVIRQGHLGDPDAEFLVVFTGRVQQCQRDKREAELTCVSASTSIKRSGLRRHYQLSCPHILYDQDPCSCKASMAARTISGVAVSAVGNVSVTLPVAWFGAYVPIKAIGGMVVWAGVRGTERRTILRMTPDNRTLTLGGLVTDLEPGDTVDVVLGCNHQVDDCEDLHENIQNFGGMPFIPQENPVKNNPFT